MTTTTVDEHTDDAATPEAVTAEDQAVQQPTEQPEPGKAVELHTERGHLTLRPGQARLDEDQRGALLAIGIDTVADPGVFPHLRAFVHMCQIRGLDPWAREAYLIGRGQGDKRKYTMQTGIDGYRKMAASTGRFIRVKDVLWTGSEDDDRSYRLDANGVMRRVWYDQWPASRGWPGAAKAIIEHYDPAGNVVETEAVADWSMYAPFTDKWEWGETRGQKKYLRNPDGSKVKELNEMWTKGPAHMLGKCLPGKARIRTDRGSLTIREIVRKRLPVKVRSIDLATGAEVWQPVVNWWTNAPTTDWVRLWAPNASRGNKPIRVTHDHPVWTPTGWVKAGEIVEGDLVAVTSPTLSPRQRQVVLGGLLGDAHLAGRKRSSSQPHLAIGHSTAQRDYVDWTASALASLGTTVTEGTHDDGTGRRHPVVNLRTAAAAALYEFRQTYPIEWLRDLDDLGLAVWIMDDGSIKATGGASGSVSLDIHCCGFGVDFAEAAVAWFRDRGITAAVRRPEKNPYLSIGVDDARHVLDTIAPYLVREGTRKVWVAEPIEQGHERGMAFVPVTKVEHVRNRWAETRYDIEVEGTHTFVTNGLVVSNCAEALAHRRAFPATMSGIYVHEEMARLDQAERDRLEIEQRTQRQQAYADHHARAATQGSPVVQGEAVNDATPAPVGAEPVHIADAVTEVATQLGAAVRPAATEADRLRWLVAELRMLAEVIGQPVEGLVKRQIDRLGKPVQQFTADELQLAVNPLRKTGAAKLRAAGEASQAEAYAQAPPGVAMPLSALLGLPAETEAEAAASVNPAAPHLYADRGGVCTHCGAFADEPIHLQPGS